MEGRGRFATTTLVLAFFLALPATVFAQSDPPQKSFQGSNYAMIQVGAIVPSNGDTTWSVNGILGRYLTPNIALEGSLGYYSTDYTYGEMTVWPVSLSVKAGIPVRRLFPYAIAGGDLYFVDAKVAGKSDSDTPLGYHLGAGVEFSVSGNFYVGVEYRYTFVEATLFGVNQKLDGGGTTGTFGVRF